MRITRTYAVILLILIVIFSIFVANVANLISVDYKLERKLTERDEESDIWHKGRMEAQLTDTTDHIMWFLQISDLHISHFADQSRVTELKDFASRTVSVIQPSVVLASGDLTDARIKNHLGSKQFEKEWELYSSVLKETGILNHTVWLDIRGNHDNFNVPHHKSHENLFLKYSAQGRKHKKSYMQQITKGADKYTFIAVDACIDPGPKRPLNFIGILSAQDVEELIEMVRESRRMGGNYTVWFGHYPTSCIMAPNAKNGGIRSVIGQFDEGLAYLCGHLHTLGGLVPKMYTRQKAGFLELELGDWKDNRLVRLAAIDHGLFSFVDFVHGEWPIVLITNPKNALFNIPGREGAHLQRNSTHIRLLAFSIASIVECNARVDLKPWADCIKSDNHLYVMPWNAAEYGIGIHTIEVLVRDSDGRQQIVKQSFVLDGTTEVAYHILPKLFLMSDACQIFQAMFGTVMAIAVLPLCFLKIWHVLVIAGKVKKPQITTPWLRRNVRKFWLLASIDRLFFPIILFCMYLSVGPWSFGEVIDGHMSVIFVWGIFVNGVFLPGSLTYLYGFWQMLLCQIPLILIYANCVNKRYLRKFDVTIKPKPFLMRILFNSPFILIMTVEIVLAFVFWSSYGTMAFLIGPLRTWSVILNMSLWFICNRLPEHIMKPTKDIWTADTKAAE